VSGAVRLFFALGAANAALAVILGAFGAHTLRAHLTPQQLATFHTGVEYHVYHALGLLGVAFAASLLPGSALVRASGWLMLAGIVLFSGSLYALSLSGLRWLGAITPFGGTAFIVAWVLLAVAVARG
jgi:uncharacterized membrane protein YgdD (TMEM256/DUF423 family)